MPALKPAAARETLAAGVINGLSGPETAIFIQYRHQEFPFAAPPLRRFIRFVALERQAPERIETQAIRLDAFGGEIGMRVGRFSRFPMGFH